MHLKPADPALLALKAVNQISAMVAYWDAEQRCVFANAAYREWFGKSPEEMVGMHLSDLLGPLHEMNLPHILGALSGEPQQFERRIPLPQGGTKDSIATYTPDVVDGVVRGFWVHAADVTPLREREAMLKRALADRDEALAEARTLRGLLPVCAACKKIRDVQGAWHGMEEYVALLMQMNFTHTLCPCCLPNYFPGGEREGGLSSSLRRVSPRAVFGNQHWQTRHAQKPHTECAAPFTGVCAVARGIFGRRVGAGICYDLRA